MDNIEKEISGLSPEGKAMVAGVRADIAAGKRPAATQEEALAGVRNIKMNEEIKEMSAKLTDAQKTALMEKYGPLTVEQKHIVLKHFFAQKPVQEPTYIDEK